MNSSKSPDPAVAIENYVINRCDFYTVVKERLRQKEILEALETAVEPVQSAHHTGIQAAVVSPLVLSDYESALLLRDIYKKPVFGQQRAKTVVSVGDLLQAAQDVEEAGLLLFRHLTHLGDIARKTFQPMEQFHEERLSRLIELADRLRYHRMKLT